MILLGNDLPGSLPIRQVSKLKVLLPSKKSYLSQTTRQDKVLSPSEQYNQSDLLNLVLRCTSTRPVGERTWQWGCDLLAFATTWICVGWKPNIYSWTLSSNHSQIRDKRTLFKRFCLQWLTESDKTIRRGDCERNHLIGFDCAVNQ